ncbi:cob(I)yrinic acid a,c-diamide adenosyltransferase [uncultured Intestinimonas sp.]|uniref:cob(I)yrinic acid a,c-diamide adenosyltransferase n=1 Tax=uncultured Intestinimonas sp. TaxID=1689265 RepID=UPI0025E44A56|nr:cob(I)yrinic acid a,c-diamide adenosyltransferase [uncultured Intestinimonas sp.]
MIHIYCGDGKGKTTCAFGLALRAAGRGRKVLITQFLKTGDSGERTAIAHVPGVTLLEVPERMKFTFRMNEAEKVAFGAQMKALLEQTRTVVEKGELGLLVLDECCAAVAKGLLPLEDVLSLLDSVPEDLEVIITGRNPDPALVERADYITEMKKIRHPFDKGVAARKGIEW